MYLLTHKVHCWLNKEEQNVVFIERSRGSKNISLKGRVHLASCHLLNLGQTRFYGVILRKTTLDSFYVWISIDFQSKCLTFHYGSVLEQTRESSDYLQNIVLFTRNISHLILRSFIFFSFFLPFSSYHSSSALSACNPIGDCQLRWVREMRDSNLGTVEPQSCALPLSSLI
jgi:hypothetical protein